MLGNWHFKYRRLVLMKWTPGRESICAMVRLIVDACAMAEIAVMVGKLIFGTKTWCLPFIRSYAYNSGHLDSVIRTSSKYFWQILYLENDSAPFDIKLTSHLRYPILSFIQAGTVDQIQRTK